MYSPIRLSLGRSDRPGRASRATSAQVAPLLALEPRCLMTAGLDASPTLIPAAAAPVPIIALVPTPRTNPLSSVTVAFTAPINPASFTFNALSLTLNGVNVPLNDFVQVTPVPASMTVPANTMFEVGGLVPFTSTAGHYALTVNGAAVTDPAGNPGTGTSTVPFDELLPTPPPGPPSVIALLRFGIHQQTPQIVLQFDQAMNPFTTSFTGNYALFPVVNGRVASSPSFAVTSADYDPQLQRVTLTTFPQVRLHHTYLIEVNGSGPTGVSNEFGQGLVGGRFARVFAGIASLSGINTTGQPPRMPLGASSAK